MSALVAVILMALVAGVVVLGRALGRVGPLWLRPAHAPLWLASGVVVALAVGIAQLAVPRPAEALGTALRVAADGPGARVTHLALALASIVMIAPVSRAAFAMLRRRRLDRSPVPAWFRLFGVGPDGRELRSLRARLFVPALVLALAAAGAGALVARGDTTWWAGLVALLTSGALAVAPWPRAAARAPEVATAEAGPAPEAPDPLPALLAALQRDGVAARAEHRAAIAGSARLPARIVAAARAGDAIALGPIGAGKTGAALEVVRAEALEEFGGNVPQVGNGRVSVERFRITIEKVDEPPEVIHERIRKLWRTTSNHHHYDPLKHAAAKFGLDLDSKEFGADVPGGM